jgi:16S rRNA (cytidine1402-2'-O)-methyltransferase
MENNLFVVATPIGNLQDISERAIKILKISNAYIAENFITFKKLCTAVGVDIKDKQVLRFGDFNNKNSLQRATDLILKNKNTCLITEAGTPLISDPGFKIVQSLRENYKQVNIVPVPGPSALTAHLSVSGLPTDKFMFIGFLPKTKSKRNKILESLGKINNVQKTTFVMYESKYKLLQTVEAINTLYPSSYLSVAKELTKLNEKVFYGPTNSVLKELNTSNLKGEFVLHLMI